MTEEIVYCMTKQNNFIALRLSTELKQKIVETAQRQQRTLSNYVKSILLREVEGHD